MMVVILILATLMLFVLSLINPAKQLSRASDSRRLHDLTAIRDALDTYHNDLDNYPTSLSFGSAWNVGGTTGTVYMAKVPQDSNASSPYIYQIDPASKQWAVVYAKLASTNTPDVCPLTKLSDCVPIDYASLGYNACVLLGSVDCAYISASRLIAVTPTPTSTPVPTPTPTPTPISACAQENRNYACTGNPARCNLVQTPGTGTYCVSDCDGACP